MKIPGLNLPSKAPGPRISWLSSLRPHAQSLLPDIVIKEGTPAPPGATRIRRGPLVAACALVCGALLAGGAFVHRVHRRGKAVESVVSGRAGLRKTSSGAVEHWSSPALTVTIDPTLAAATPTAKQAIMDAFGAWASSGAYLPQVTVDVTTTPGTVAEDGVNRLLFGPITIAGQEKALAITVSYADPDTGEVIEADTLFNSAYEWTSMASAAGDRDDERKCSHRYDLQNVATHEAGHFFGLGEDYREVTTTMFATSEPCQTSKRVLSSSDVAVVSSLYSEPIPVDTTPKAGCGGH